MTMSNEIDKAPEPKTEKERREHQIKKLDLTIKQSQLVIDKVQGVNLIQDMLELMQETKLVNENEIKKLIKLSEVIEQKGKAI